MGVTPSLILGLTPGSYEAFCLDQATWYYGTSIQAELDKVGRKRHKGEANNEAARKRVLEKYLGTKQAKGQYADPAVLFGMQ